MSFRWFRTCLSTGILLFFFYFTSHGQDAFKDQEIKDSIVYSIQWKGQYPEPVEFEETERKGIAKFLFGEQKRKRQRENSRWFNNLLFGEKPGALVKPMSVLALNPDTFWIADQGTGSFIEVKNMIGEVIKFRNPTINNLPSIVSSCFLPGNKILFTDSQLNKIYQFVPGEKHLQIINDSLILDQPTGIAYSSKQRIIWIAETGKHRLVMLNDKGEWIRSIGNRGTGPGEFNFPTYLWIDREGILYVVDAMNFRIQLFDSEGNFLTEFGEIGDASGYLSRPKGIATDSFGHIYLADALFHVVQVFDRSGQLLFILGSQGKDQGQFWMPTGLFIDEHNNIYVADSYNSRVQLFELILGE